MLCQQSVSPAVSNPLPWYALRTKSNQERTVATALNQKGFECYLPVYQTRRRWSDRIMEIELPLFSGYLFCRFRPAKRLPVITTPGVVSILGFGNEPVPIPESEIAAVQTALHSGLATVPCAFPRAGQR